MLNLSLQLNELIERQAPPGRLGVGACLREVQQAHRRGARGQIERAGGQLQLRPRLGDVFFEPGERSPDQRPEPALGQALGERVNRGQAVKVDEVLLAVLDDFRFRVVHGSRLEADRFAEDDHLFAHREVFLHERQVPPPAMQPRRAVIEDELEDGLGVLLVPLNAERDDRAPGGNRLLKRQVGDSPQLPAVLVTPWPMQEQVFDSADLQPSQLRRAFRADAGQGGYGSGKGRDR